MTHITSHIYWPHTIIIALNKICLNIASSNDLQNQCWFAVLIIDLARSDKNWRQGGFNPTSIVHVQRTACPVY